MPSSKLYKVFHDPPALYDYQPEPNFRHFKHLNKEWNSRIQVLLRKTKIKNQAIWCSFVIFGIIAMIIGVQCTQRYNYHIAIGKNALDMQANMLMLRPEIETYKHFKYSQHDTRDIQELNTVLKQYRRDYDEMEHKIIE